MSANSTGQGDQKLKWRYELGENEDPAPRVKTVAGEMKAKLINRAWGRLLIQHTPFLPVDEREYARLVDRYRELEELVLNDPKLQRYYAESFLPTEARAEWMLVDRDPAGNDEPVWKLHHVATLQAQLMEDVFYAFRLDRHANAPDNRGWMNLFRRWGESAAFRERFDVMRSTFSRAFIEFYDYYVRSLRPIDVSPVPHPWDSTEGREDPRPQPPSPEGDEEMEEAIEHHVDEGTRVLPGVYLDSGIREAEPQKPQSPHPTSSEHASQAEKPPVSSSPPPSSPPPAGGGAPGPE